MTLVSRSLLIGMALLVLLRNDASRVHAQAKFELVEKAQPDEFYTGIGKEYYAYGDQPRGTKGQPKVNYDYIWGMDTDSRYIWFGTAANVGALGLAGAGLPVPIEFKSPAKKILYRVWESGASKYPRGMTPVESILGDWRPPKVYRYDTQTDTLIDFTPNDPLIKKILGLRSLTVFNGIVLAGGPTFEMNGICLFAFDANTGQFLGSKLLSEYSNIRKWLNVNGVLYTAVQSYLPIPSRGAVLRWCGNRQSPFQFETVGLIDNDGAYLAAHEGRLIVGTWPSPNMVGTLLMQTTPVVGLWASPQIPAGGLTREHALFWVKTWKADRYEPDPVIAGTYSMGAMVPFGEYLYFGTMHYPGLAVQSFRDAYPDYQASLLDIPKMDRAALLLRAKNWSAPLGPTVELLYGNAAVYVFTPNSDGDGGTWALLPNKTGLRGRFGNSGFGDSTNYYVWSGTVHKGALILGTFAFNPDFGQLVDGVKKPAIGADLYRFSSTSSAAQTLSINGLGNPANHGVRNIVSTPKGLYLGTANGMNLLTNTSDKLPDGGWELRRWVE